MGKPCGRPLEQFKNIIECPIQCFGNKKSPKKLFDPAPSRRTILDVHVHPRVPARDHDAQRLVYRIVDGPIVEGQVLFRNILILRVRFMYNAHCRVLSVVGAGWWCTQPLFYFRQPPSSSSPASAILSDNVFAYSIYSSCFFAMSSARRPSCAQEVICTAAVRARLLARFNPPIRGPFGTLGSMVPDGP